MFFIVLSVYTAQTLTVNVNISHTPKRRCGGLKHAALNRPCPSDKHCGIWRDRFWHPLHCTYDDITSEQARQCLGNRTLAFIGDSMTRDLGVGVAMLLLGQTLQEAPTHKLDYKHDMNWNATVLPNYPGWKNVPGHNFNGHVFPQREVAEQYGYTWQVQIWNFFRNYYLHTETGHLAQVSHVLNNDMVNATSHNRAIDLAFWQHGLHDTHFWPTPPYGEKYFNGVVNRFLVVRDKVKVPVVWMSMNPGCAEKLSDSMSPELKETQVKMVEEANIYTNNRTLHEKIPYWDTAAVFYSADRCAISDDGVHSKMWVEIMRAKMLFNHLCDRQMKWLGDDDLHSILRYFT